MSRHIRESYGFPSGHPPMATFLGVPLSVRGEVWGSLYLTEKTGGEEFDEADEEVVELLGGWAASAIDNARLFRAAEQGRASWSAPCGRSRPPRRSRARSAARRVSTGCSS